jgi:single-stranded-DNA-specific exonuclease
MITGSARTVNDFDIHAALCECEDLLVQFGGHTHAAGLSLLPENLTAFQERFEEVVQRCIQVEDLLIKQHIDAGIHLNQVYLPGESFAKIPRFMRVLQEFEPFGPGNMKPVFLFKQVYSHSYLLLKEAHLKLKIQQVDSPVKLDAIGFNMAEHSNTVSLGLAYDLACTFETSTFRDKTTLQLMIKDLRPTV